VKVNGVAKQKGSLGELVLVETFDGRERFMARVTGIRQLEVFTTGATAMEHATLTTGPGQLR
jgi:hypothetical protein